MENDDAFRSSADRARQVIERLLPRPDVRAAVEHILADAIVHAHDTGSSSWGVTLYEDKLRLNVGSVESVVLWSGGCHLVVDQTLVSSPLKREIGGRWRDAGHYRTYPQGASVDVDSPTLEKVYSLLKPAHFSAIEQCARRRGYNWKGSHSPGVLRYLEARTGMVLPMPSYLAPEASGDLSLADECIYTTANPAELPQRRGAHGHRTEKKWWARGKELLGEAEAEGRRMPVLFSDAAEDCSRLVGWALLDEVEPDGLGTRFSFSDWHRFAASKTQELVLLGTGAPIAPRFRRPYAICRTPWFLRYQRAATAIDHVVRAWVVKGNPARNDLDEMRVPHELDRWITAKPPKNWARGDAVFFWKSSPALEIVGFGRIAETTTERDEEGNVGFTLEYLTGPLPHRLGLKELREDRVLGTASFLKAGPAGTVFPLSLEQARQLARLVLQVNPSCTSVFEDHLLGIGGVEVLNADDAGNLASYLDPEDLAMSEQHEGRRVLVKHWSRERSPSLRERARDLHRERSDGRLPCSICDFDFAEVYGPGSDYAEVHHDVPLSTYDEQGAPTRVEDLVVVCANCHRMLHRLRPWLRAAELKRRLEAGVKSA